MNHETIAHAQVIEQEVDQLNRQLTLIDENLKDLTDLKGSLESMDKPEVKEIMVNIGKRVFVPVTIKEKKLLIDVGKNNFVKKTIPESFALIDEQIARLLSGKTQIMERLHELEEQMEELIKKVESRQKS